jgi:predicted lipid carrier protein YhbT
MTGPAGWRRTGWRPALPTSTPARLALHPLGTALTVSLRRVLRNNPGLGERLDAARGATIRIAPDELPVAFLIRIAERGGQVTAVPKAAADPVDVSVAAPLRLLLTIFQGEDDGDAAFFSSELRIDGAMAPLVSLRNAIEAAGLNWTDILPLPLPPGLAPALRRIG